MSAQTTYRYNTPMGHAGGIVDLAPYAIDTFINEAENGVMRFGVGVVKGTAPGKNVNLPADGADVADFEGVTINGRTTEYDMDGKLALRKGASVGVMRYGRIYVRVAKDVAPAYGEAAYVIASGEEAGCFTNAADGAVAVKARFLSGVDTAAQVAMVELFNQAQA